MDLGIENGGSFQLAMLSYQRVAIEKLQTDYLYLIYPLKMVISMVMLPGNRDLSLSRSAPP